MSGDPLATVVIPTHDRPRALAACLAALGGQHFTVGAFEVVIVDDGGSLPLDGIVEPHRERLAVTLLRQRQAGPAAARNAGAAVARGRLLAFTDDDCRPEPGWLEALVAVLVRAPGSVAAGRTVNQLEESCLADASQMLLAFLYAEGARRTGEIPFVASNNLAVARRDFTACGGFDESFHHAGGEDRDFSDRARLLGCSLVYEPTALVQHAHVMGLQGYVRQHFDYGRGAYRLHRARVRRGAKPLRVESPSFYAAMLASPFRELPPRRRAATVSALIALAQVGTAAGFLAEASAAAGADRARRAGASTRP